MTRAAIGPRAARQRYALHLLDRCVGRDDGWGVVNAHETAAIDGQAWIHYRTAEALEARGLVEIDRSMGRDCWRLRRLDAGEEDA